MMGQMRRNIAKIVTGTALGQGIVVAVSPILTRLYGPADFGVVSLYTAVISVLIVVGSLKYDTAIPLPADEHASRSLVALSVVIVVLIAGGMFLVIALAGNKIVLPIGKELVPYAYLIVLGFLLGGVYQVLSYWAVRRRDYGAIAITKASQGVGTATTQVALGFLGGPLGLLLGDIVGRFAGFGYLLRRSGLRHQKKIVNRKSIMSAARAYRKFPAISAPAGFMNALGLNLPAILIAQYWGISAAGAYAIVQRVFGAPMALIGRSVVQVYYGEASACLNSGSGKLLELFNKVVSQLAALAVPVALAAFAAPWLFEPLFGEKWKEAGYVAAALGVMFALQVVVVPISQTLQITGRQGSQLIWDIGRLILVVLVFYVSDRLSLKFLSAICVYSVCMVVSYLFLYLMCRNSAADVARP